MDKIIFIFVMILIVPSLALTQEGWKCGNKIVYRGDTKAQVLAKCGEPLGGHRGPTHTGGRVTTQTQRYRGGYSETYGQYRSTTVESESLIYEESHGLMYEYIFIGGKLRDVKYVGKKD